MNRAETIQMTGLQIGADILYERWQAAEESLREVSRLIEFHQQIHEARERPNVQLVHLVADLRDVLASGAAVTAADTPSCRTEGADTPEAGAKADAHTATVGQSSTDNERGSASTEAPSVSPARSDR